MILKDPWDIPCNSAESSSYFPPSFLLVGPHLTWLPSCSLYSKLHGLQPHATVSHPMCFRDLMFLVVLTTPGTFPPDASHDWETVTHHPLKTDSFLLLPIITGQLISFLPGYSRLVLDVSCLTAPLGVSPGSKDQKGHICHGATMSGME